MAHSNIRTALLAATEADVIAYAERQLSAAMANEQKTKSREFSVRLGWGELRTLLNTARRSLAAEDGPRDASTMSASTLPTPEQQQRAAWDLLLLNIEARTEQARQLKTYEPRRLVIQGLTAGAALLAAGAALGGTIIALLLRGH